MMKLFRPLLLYLLLLSIIAGCTPVGLTPEAGSPSSVEPASPSQSAPVGATETVAAPEPPADPVTPTVRAGLEASDPAIFTLASGDLQLVEFFAFW